MFEESFTLEIGDSLLFVANLRVFLSSEVGTSFINKILEGTNFKFLNWKYEISFFFPIFLKLVAVTRLGAKVEYL